MESNNNDYVLVLEDRTDVKNAQEVGTLSVVSGIDEAGKLKTSEAKETQQASFLKFNNQDGLLKNFMKNFLKVQRPNSLWAVQGGSEQCRARSGESACLFAEPTAPSHAGANQISAGCL